jgi:hypothetical protein
MEEVIKHYKAIIQRVDILLNAVNRNGSENAANFGILEGKVNKRLDDIEASLKEIKKDIKELKNKC